MKLPSVSAALRADAAGTVRCCRCRLRTQRRPSTGLDDLPALVNWSMEAIDAAPTEVQHSGGLVVEDGGAVAHVGNWRHCGFQVPALLIVTPLSPVTVPLAFAVAPLAMLSTGRLKVPPALQLSVLAMVRIRRRCRIPYRYRAFQLRTHVDGGSAAGSTGCSWCRRQA